MCFRRVDIDGLHRMESKLSHRTKSSSRQRNPRAFPPRPEGQPLDEREREQDGVGEDVEPDEVARQGAHGEGCQRPEKDVRNEKDETRAEALEGASQKRSEARAAAAERPPAAPGGRGRGPREADAETEALPRSSGPA